MRLSALKEMVTGRQGSKAIWVALMILLVPFVYFLLIGRYGWGDRDNGFMLSFAWRVYKGELPYRDFIYVRPPISPFVHSIWFALFPSKFLAASTRMMALWQDWIIALLGSFVLCRYCFSEDQVLQRNWLGVALASFLFSTCGFVPMPWYTTDGIFFGILGASLLILRTGFLASSGAALLILLSAGTKQSFYPLAVFCLVYLMALKRFRDFKVVAFVFGTVGALFALVLHSHGLLGIYLTMTSGSLHVNDGLKAGFFEYLHIGVWSFGRILFLTALPIIAFCFAFKKQFRPEFLILCFVLSVLVQYGRDWRTHFGFVSMARGGYSQLLFVASFGYGIWRLYRKRERTKQTLGFLLLLTIAWCASISWGYLSPIMFSAPLLVGGYLCLSELMAGDKRRVLVSGAVGVAVILIFASLYPYEDLDGRLHDHYDLGALNPQLTLIVSGRKTAEKMNEFGKLHHQFAGSYVILPASGWSYILSNFESPVASDWPENAEIGSREPLLEDQMSRRVTYAIVDKTFVRPVSDRFGVPLVAYVAAHWKLVYDGSWYRVYINANSRASGGLEGVGTQAIEE